MKTIIFLIVLFFAVGLNAQKPIFHALNKNHGYTQFVLWGTAPALGSPNPFSSSANACTASSTGITAWGNGATFTATNGLPTVGLYVGASIASAGWYVHTFYDPPAYTYPRAVPAIVVHVDATLHIDQIVTC